MSIKKSTRYWRATFLKYIYVVDMMSIAYAARVNFLWIKKSRRCTAAPPTHQESFNALRSLALCFLHERLVNPLGLTPLFFKSYHLMAGRLTPGRHVLLDPLVVRHDLQYLPRNQFLDLLGGHNDGHRAKVPQCIQLHIGFYHEPLHSKQLLANS